MGVRQGRGTDTATGAFQVINTILPKYNQKPEETTSAVQGFGNAGAEIAELLGNAGYRVIAVSDSRGGIYSEQGLDIPSIREYKQNNLSIKGVYCQDSVCSIVEHDIITTKQIQNTHVHDSPHPP